MQPGGRSLECGIQRTLHAGLLQDAERRAFIELGAGKGYLTLMLARATAARNFVLNDVGSFQLKADRFLRPQPRAGALAERFARCTSDLKDFVAAGALESAAFAEGAGVRGTALDRSGSAAAASNPEDSCKQSSSKLQSALHRPSEGHPSLEGVAAIAPAHPRRGSRLVETPVPHEFVGVGKHLCGAASDFALRSLLAAPPSGTHAGSAAAHATPRRRAECRGVCLATCCHFRCTWKAYVGKRALIELGFGQRDFDLLSMMAGALPQLQRSRC